MPITYYRLKEPIIEILYGAKTVFPAFGYNYAESEPIGMKSGALSIYYWGLALADFERDPRSSDSLRGSRNFFSVR